MCGRGGESGELAAALQRGLLTQAWRRWRRRRDGGGHREVAVGGLASSEMDMEAVTAAQSEDLGCPGAAKAKAVVAAVTVAVMRAAVRRVQWWQGLRCERECNCKPQRQ